MDAASWLGRALGVWPSCIAQDELICRQSDQGICLKALAKKSEERFASMQAFAAALIEITPAPASNPLPPQLPSTVTYEKQPPPLPKNLPRRRFSKSLVAFLMVLAVGLPIGLWFMVGAWRGPKKQTQEVTKPPGPPPSSSGPFGRKFVHLPKGKFYMGGGGGTTGKLTEIKEDFEIATTPLTHGQWQALMGNNPSCFSGAGEGSFKVADIKDEDLRHFPVENVSWEDAAEYIKKLNEREKERGWYYCLPTSGEWEYACRGGATSRDECSSDFHLDPPTNDLSSKQANFDGNSPCGRAPPGPYLQRTTKVGSYKPNKLGLFDMHGNVWQCCEDHSATGGIFRLARGGAWYVDGVGCRANWETQCDRGSDGAASAFGLRVPATKTD